MKCTAQALLNRYSNFQSLPPGVSGSIRSERTKRIVDGGGFNPGPVVPPFDGALCAVVLTGGGGDKFDCYTVGDAYALPDGGTGFTQTWIAADNEFGTVYGSTFDSEAVGPATTLSTGTGFADPAWYYL